MKRHQLWVNDTSVEVDVAPGGIVEVELTGFCGSDPGDLPPLTAPVAPVTGGVLAGPSWAGPVPVTDGLLRGPAGEGEVALLVGVAPLTGGSVTVESGSGAVVVGELRIDVGALLPSAAEPSLGDPLGAITIAPGSADQLTLAEGPARPQVVGDGVVINLVPRSDTGPAAFVVTGGEIQVDGGVLRAGAFQPPVSYEVHDSPVWTETIDRLYHGPVARELRSLALDGEMPTPVLRRFAVEGANWLSRGPFDLPAHLAVQLAGLPPDKRDKAMAATAAAVTLVLERLLTKATSSASPA